MTKRLTAVQLLDDFGLGGVTKAMSIFDNPRVAPRIASTTVPVAPRSGIAPVFDTDLIFTHFPPSWRTLPFLVSLRLRNPRARIIHVEHSYCRSWEALKVPSPKRFRAMLRIAFRLFDDVVAVSHDQADWLREVAGKGLPRLHAIHPWSGVQGLDTVAAPQIEAGHRLIIGAYGRYCEQKGFDVLIDAARLLDPDRFMIVLGGFGPDEAMLHQRAAGLRHIRFAGKIARPADFLSLVDVVAIPSRWEPFGQVAAEAKLAGRSIVVANVDGLPEQATGCGVVADCSTPALLADALRGLPAERLLDLGMQGRAELLSAEATRVAAWLRLVEDQADSGARISRRWKRC